MELIKIEAKSREVGKKAARATRLADDVPCVLYGSDTEPQVFQVPELALRPLVYTNEFHRVEIKLGKKTFECILKDASFHPVSDRLIHADFQVLVAGQLLTLSVPVHYEGTSLGVTDGGTPQVFVHDISIRCLPKDIPDHIAVDVTPLEIGDSILVRHLEIENITINIPEDQALISIIQPRELIEPVVEELEGEELEGVELEEGAEPGTEAGAEGSQAEGETKGQSKEKSK